MLNVTNIAVNTVIIKLMDVLKKMEHVLNVILDIIQNNVLLVLIIVIMHVKKQSGV